MSGKKKFRDMSKREKADLLNKTFMSLKEQYGNMRQISDMGVQKNYIWIYVKEPLRPDIQQTLESVVRPFRLLVREIEEGK